MNRDHMSTSVGDDKSQPAPSAVELDRFAWGIIRRKVRHLIERHHFSEQDRDDLIQELMLRLVRGLKRYRSERAHRKAFITAIVERNVIKLLRDKKAKKRDGGTVESLDEMLQQANGEDPAESVEPPADGPTPEQIDLACDVANLLDQLSPEERDLAERLMSHRLSRVARDLGIPRSTAQRRVERLRRRFEEAGLRDYLEPVR